MGSEMNINVATATTIQLTQMIVNNNDNKSLTIPRWGFSVTLCTVKKNRLN